MSIYDQPPDSVTFFFFFFRIAIYEISKLIFKPVNQLTNQLIMHFPTTKKGETFFCETGQTEGGSEV